MPRTEPSTVGRPERAVLELSVSDMMAAARHVTACLARRAQALLGLLCLPGAGEEGRLVLAVADDGRLPRLVAELAALPEVRRVATGQAVLPDLAAVFQREAAA